jgi:hypothetical protein
MIRPMTSNVSALSGGVANGHQAMHFVSSAPSKIPYGGFSPVRLQTRLTPRPPSRATTCPLIGRHCGYLRFRCLVRNRSCYQAAPKPSPRVQWPLAPQTVVLSVQIIAYYGHIRASVGHPPGLWFIPSGRGTSPPAAEGPQFTLPVHSPHAAARTPVVPTTAHDDAFIVGSAFATFAPARPPQIPPVRIWWVA